MTLGDWISTLMAQLSRTEAYGMRVKRILMGFEARNSYLEALHKERPHDQVILEYDQEVYGGFGIVLEFNGIPIAALPQMDPWQVMMVTTDIPDVREHEEPRRPLPG